MIMPPPAAAARDSGSGQHWRSGGGDPLAVFHDIPRIKAPEDFDQGAQSQSSPLHSRQSVLSLARQPAKKKPPPHRQSHQSHHSRPGRNSPAREGAERSTAAPAAVVANPGGSSSFDMPPPPPCGASSTSYGSGRGGVARSSRAYENSSVHERLHATPKRGRPRSASRELHASGGSSSGGSTPGRRSSSRGMSSSSSSSRLNLDSETEQKAIDARWKELNLKIQRHELDASRPSAKADSLDRLELALAKRCAHLHGF